MKFGGTSVGRPERMHQVAELIIKSEDPTIVVLSALSGTTNALIEISKSLASGYRSEAKQQIEELEAHYQQFINQLVTTDASLQKARFIITEHFEFLNIILKISFIFWRNLYKTMIIRIRNCTEALSCRC